MHVARGEPPSIEGLCDRRFAAVRDAFASNFVERGEVGAAVAVSVAEADLAFGYVMNDMGPRWQNPRNRALIDAVYACL